jgi:hypothetical protein
LSLGPLAVALGLAGCGASVESEESEFCGKAGGDVADGNDMALDEPGTDAKRFLSIVGAAKLARFDLELLPGEERSTCQLVTVDDELELGLITHFGSDLPSYVDVVLTSMARADAMEGVFDCTDFPIGAIDRAVYISVGSIGVETFEPPVHLPSDSTLLVTYLVENPGTEPARADVTIALNATE